MNRGAWTPGQESVITQRTPKCVQWQWTPALVASIPIPLHGDNFADCVMGDLLNVRVHTHTSHSHTASAPPTPPWTHTTHTHKLTTHTHTYTTYAQHTHIPHTNTHHAHARAHAVNFFKTKRWLCYALLYCFNTYFCTQKFQNASSDIPLLVDIKLFTIILLL